MKLRLEFIIIMSVSWCQYTETQRSALDNLVPQYQLLKDLILKIMTPPSENMGNRRLARELRILQPRVSDDVPFPCALNNTRSIKRPTSVHSLRPGDIDVIGAIGDSLTAGNGLLATNILQIYLQNRGAAFSGGGQGTWRRYVTLPNILKEFNPNLIGYSTKDSFIHHKESQFNVAEAGAMSRDMPFMAKELVRRIKDDPRVNTKDDWKMISFMIGDNDFCSDMCYHSNPETILESHRVDLIKVLRVLRDNLPRTIVNLVIVPHLKVLRTVSRRNRPPICYITHNFECPCMFGLQFQNQLTKFDEIMLKWQELEMEIGLESEFDQEDFTVVVQPFTYNYTLAKTKEGLSDYSVLSQDCFHLSQKEGARAALSLWNNLLEPVGAKTTSPTELFNFKCPSTDYPYIFTRRNSMR